MQPRSVAPILAPSNEDERFPAHPGPTSVPRPPDGAARLARCHLGPGARTPHRPLPRRAIRPPPGPRVPGDARRWTVGNHLGREDRFVLGDLRRPWPARPRARLPAPHRCPDGRHHDDDARGAGRDRGGNAPAERRDRPPLRPILRRHRGNRPRSGRLPRFDGGDRPQGNPGRHRGVRTGRSPAAGAPPPVPVSHGGRTRRSRQPRVRGSRDGTRRQGPLRRSRERPRAGRPRRRRRRLEPVAHPAGRPREGRTARGVRLHGGRNLPRAPEAGSLPRQRPLRPPLSRPGGSSSSSASSSRASGTPCASSRSRSRAPRTSPASSR